MKIYLLERGKDYEDSFVMYAYRKKEEAEKERDLLREEDKKEEYHFYYSIREVELFSRKKIEGWDCIGNEIDGKDIREILK